MNASLKKDLGLPKSRDVARGLFRPNQIGSEINPTLENELPEYLRKSLAITKKIEHLEQSSTEVVQEIKKSWISNNIPAPLPLFEENEGIATSTTNLPPKTGTAAPLYWPHPFHIDSVPCFEEPFYQCSRQMLLDNTRLNYMKRTSHPELVYDRIVYDCDIPNPNRNKNSPGERVPYYVPSGSDDPTLVFESRFESGNLRRAVQVYEAEYDLFLKSDPNTKNTTQWFYFSVRGMKRGRRYKFNILNFVKPDSLFNEGMQPVVYSQKSANAHGLGWHRGGEDVCYYPNSSVRAKGKSFYSLSFTYVPIENDDKIYFAYHYPYSYTMLQTDLKRMLDDPLRRKYIKRRLLCRSLAGNGVDLLTISDFCDEKSMSQKKCVIITARVHPGESNSSYAMKGILEYLTGTSQNARELRKLHIFQLIPMLNPDGVITGAYRCNLGGVDLNRTWIDPSRRLHPSIYFTKQLIKRTIEDRELLMYVDIHGHSRRSNMFMYGCEAEPIKPESRLLERIFPRMLWRRSENFSYDCCNFQVQKAKEKTGRVVVRREFNLVNSYTLELSFSGASFGPYNGLQFSQKHYMEMGRMFCECLLEFQEETGIRYSLAKEELQLLHPQPRDGKVSSTQEENEASEGDLETPPSFASSKAKRKSSKGKLTSKDQQENGASKQNKTRSKTRVALSSKSKKSSANRAIGKKKISTVRRVAPVQARPKSTGSTHNIHPSGSKNGRSTASRAKTAPMSQSTSTRKPKK